MLCLIELTGNQKEKLLKVSKVALLGEVSKGNTFHLEISLENQTFKMFHFNFSISLCFSPLVSLFLYYSPLPLLLSCSYFSTETEMNQTRKVNEK